MADFAKVMIEKNALPSLKEGIEIGREVLEKKLQAYRIKKFEEKKGMDTELFIKLFERGELGDDKEWIEWEHLASVTSILQKKITDLEGLRYEY